MDGRLWQASAQQATTLCLQYNFCGPQFRAEENHQLTIRPEVLAALPTVTGVIHLPYLDAASTGPAGAVLWADLHPDLREVARVRAFMAHASEVMAELADQLGPPESAAVSRPDRSARPTG